MVTLTLLSVALLIFLAGNVFRILKTLRRPAHLRWELYPIPKGPRDRQRYGGSYFEESEWWTKPSATGHRGELEFILKEVLFLRGIWENFRSLWPWSWLLHWGLYFYLGTTLLAFAEVLLQAGSRVGMLDAAVLYGYRIACAVGLVGALGLLAMRSWHPRLRAFKTRQGIFDLLLLGSIFATGMALLVAGPNGLQSMIGDMMRSRVYPDSHPVIGRVHLVLLGFFLAYFPFTHMTHAYMKYFTWHGVRWDDSPIFRDPHAEKRIAANLRRKASWAAPHIAAGGTASWAEVTADANGNGAGKRA